MRHITVRVVDATGRPEHYAEVTAYKQGLFTGGAYRPERTDRDGMCEFALDLSDTDRVSFVARSGSKRGESGYDTPRASIRIVVS